MTPPPADRASLRARRIAAARLASLFDLHATMVLGLCRLLLRDHHEAEDAAQQTFVSAYRSMLRGTEPRDAAPWLAAIARNECRARIRKRMRAPVPIESELGENLPDPSDIAEETERRAELAALTAAIADLPSRQREALALRDFLGLSYEEVASTLSVSVPVVESLLFRARRRLRDTVRTAPRYAASVAALPFALKAAVTRDGADLEVAGAAGAAAAALIAVVAKVVSLPFGAKAATAVTVVALAAAGPQVPKMFDGGPATGAGQATAIARPADAGAPPPASTTPAPPPAKTDEKAPAPTSEAAEEAPASDGGAVSVAAPPETAPVRATPPTSREDEEEPAEEVSADPIREVVGAGDVTDEEQPPAAAPATEPAPGAEVPVIGLPEDSGEGQPAPAEGQSAPAEVPVIGLSEDGAVQPPAPIVGLPGGGSTPPASDDPEADPQPAAENPAPPAGPVAQDPSGLHGLPPAVAEQLNELLGR